MNMFDVYRKRYGGYAVVRMAHNLGIDFIDCYVAMFGRMPRKL